MTRFEKLKVKIARWFINRALRFIPTGKRYKDLDLALRKVDAILKTLLLKGKNKCLKSK